MSRRPKATNARGDLNVATSSWHDWSTVWGGRYAVQTRAQANANDPYTVSGEIGIVSPDSLCSSTETGSAPPTAAAFAGVLYYTPDRIWGIMRVDLILVTAI